MLKSLLLLSVFLVYIASANNVLASYPKQLNYAPIPCCMQNSLNLAHSVIDHSGDDHPNTDGNSDSHSDGNSDSHPDRHSDSNSDSNSDSHPDRHSDSSSSSGNSGGNSDEPHSPDSGPGL